MRRTCSANAYQTLGQSPEAISAWKSTLELEPNHAQALYSLSRALSKASPEEAARYRTRFTSLQAQSGATERARTLSNFALAAAKAGKWNDAIAQLYEAIQVCGNCTSGPALHKNLGLTQCQAGRFEECEKELRSAARRPARRCRHSAGAEDPREYASESRAEPHGSRTVMIRSAATFSSRCTLPLGQFNSSSFTRRLAPSPKCTRLSFEDR